MMVTVMPWDQRIKRRFKLRELDILIAVAEAGGMAKAASRLHMSQPAVSKAIADLEHTLNVRLVDRSRQGVEPTDYGLALIKRGVAVFDELRQGVQDIEFIADPTAGELRIGATPGVIDAIVSPIIERLTLHHPRMAFQVVAGDTAMLLPELTERNIELAIGRMTGPVADKPFIVERLFDDNLVVAASAKSPWCRRRKIELAELVNEPWTLLPLDSLFGSLVAESFRASRIEAPRLTVATSSQSLRNHLLATGRFLTVVPTFLLKLPRRHPSLKALPVELPNMRHPIAIITLKNRSLSPLALLFIERVRVLTRAIAKGN
jgi:DNA-binding transcriptional LysR family regulator